MSSYGTVLDNALLLEPGRHMWLGAGGCPPNAKCKQEKNEDKRGPLITTAGITDQWWFLPAVVVGAWWLFKGRN